MINRGCVIDLDHSDTTVAGTATNREIAEAAFALLLACRGRDGKLDGGTITNIGQSPPEAKQSQFP